MNKTELISELRKYNSDDHLISAVLYFVLEEDESFSLKKVDLENNLQEKITTQFKDYISSKYLDNEDLSYMNLSDIDERKNVAYRYDFSDEIEALGFLDQVVGDTEYSTFNNNNDNINNLFGYVMLVGNENFKLSTFKKHHPIDFVRRDRRLYIFPSQERFTEMQTDGFILNKGFDFMKVNGDLVINSPKILEKHFAFDEIINH